MTVNSGGRRAPSSRPGLTPADVVVGLFVLAVAFLFLVMAATRARETARATMCQKNLAQIGMALAYYDGAFGGLPTVGVPAAVDAPIESSPPGPLRAMLEALGVSTFLGLDPEGRALPGLRAALPEGVPVAGFLCPSDSTAIEAGFASPVSYRATVGDDPAGAGGPFAIGRTLNMAEVERRDGLSFTAAFSERLIGNGRAEDAIENYYISRRFTPDRRDEPTATAGEPWRGDAGSTWKPADFRYTLYTHAVPPGWRGSRVAIDGRAADMGASSAHVRGVNLLMLDGSARIVTPSITREVWESYASIGPEPAPAAPAPTEE